MDIDPGVSTALLDSDLTASSGLPNEDLPTHSGNAVCAICFQVKAILHGKKEAGDLLRWDTYSFDVMFG
jgi:hypothetical protein